MLATSIRKLIAPVLRDCPRECGIVSITRIDVSSDLSYVTVYFTALKESQLALKFLMSRERELRKILGQLQTHKTPQLRFRIDKTAEEGSRIDALLEKAFKNTPGESSASSQ